jgi:hypothetical protein
MQQTDNIKTAETEYLEILYNYIKALFAGTFLPSHDHVHHSRVWLFAVDLLSRLSENGIEFSSQDTANLMLAVFFHDSGLTRTLKEDHGKESRKICGQFLSGHPQLFQHDTSPALDAIEMHDDKSYLSAINPEMPDILSILSVCDDADAYGAIGVVRYAEIYQLRGIATEALPRLVLDNIRRRFDFFSSLPWIPAPFFNLHKERFDFACNFFEVMIKEGCSSHHDANKIIIDRYMDRVMSGSIEIESFASSLEAEENTYIKSFGKLLGDELKAFFINLPL